MINVGDTVKVISATEHNGEMVEFYPIGTICRVVEKQDEECIGIIPYDNPFENYPYYYLDSELEKGKLEWVPNQSLSGGK